MTDLVTELERRGGRHGLQVDVRGRRHGQRHRAGTPGRVGQWRGADDERAIGSRWTGREMGRSWMRVGLAAAVVAVVLFALGRGDVVVALLLGG